MVVGVPGAGPNSVLGEWLRRLTPHPDTFICGVRWPDGDATGGTKRWRYRRAWVDPLRDGGVVTTWFGRADAVRVRLDDDPWWSGAGPSPRPGLLVLSGRSGDNGAHVLLAVPRKHVVRYGVRSR